MINTGSNMPAPGVKAFPINRGDGCKKKPLNGDRYETPDRFMSDIISISKRYGDCWVHMGGLEKLWIQFPEFDGFLCPVPRGPRQAKDLARFQPTPAGIEWHENKNP